MKKVFFLILILLNLNCLATTYYVKVAGQSNNTGLSDTMAWPPDKINNVTLNPGDSVLFKRGDVFNFVLNAQSSGTPAKRIVYDAYGTGANPKFTQFQTLTNWTPSTGSIYSCDFDIYFVNLIVTLDGQIQGCGRFPKVGYKTYTNSTNLQSGINSLIGNDISSLPFDPTGGQVVIKKHRSAIDVDEVVSVSGNALNYKGSNVWGNNYTDASGGTGFFIQNHIKTLTQKGDWFYDKATKKLFMHFGPDQPSSHVVKAGTGFSNLVVNGESYLTFNNLDFEGANLKGVSIESSDNIIVDNCKVFQQGGNGFAINGSNITILNCQTKDCLNAGIDSYQTVNLLIDGAKVENSGLIPGLGKSGDGQTNGIQVLYGSCVIRKSSVVNSGFNGISTIGEQFIVEKNFVDNCCLLKDDGGCYYAYNSDKSGTLPKIIRNNIGLNAIGTTEAVKTQGSDFGLAVGVYLDSYSTNITVDNNFVANGGWCGILNNGGKNNSFTNNTCYNFGIAQFIHNKANVGATDVSNNTVKGNTFIAKEASQFCMYFYTNGVENPNLYGTYDNNIYAKPIDGNQLISENGNTNKNLDNWKTYSGQDANSKESPFSISDTSRFRLDYNYSANSATVSLTCFYKDVLGLDYNPVIPAYAGRVTVNTAKVIKIIANGQ